MDQMELLAQQRVWGSLAGLPPWCCSISAGRPCTETCPVVEERTWGAQPCLMGLMGPQSFPMGIIPKQEMAPNHFCRVSDARMSPQQ